MTKEFIPTKEKTVINGNTVYLNDEGHLVLEQHSSGSIVVTDNDGKITTTRPNGIVTTVFPDGASETRDSEGNLIHQAAQGQSYTVSKDGDVDF